MLVSIIIPIYNVGKYLYESLLSVEKQDFRDFELILINDGSTDESLSICEEFVKKSKISKIIIIDKPNEGVAAARNDGVHRATGEWIMFMDADDILEENALTILTSYIADNINIIIGSHSLLVDEKKIFKPNESKGIYNSSQYIDRYLLHKVETAPWGKLFRKAIVVDYVFDLPKEIRVQEDTIMNFRIACTQNQNVLFIDEPIYVYRWLRIGSAMYNSYNSFKNLEYDVKILNYLKRTLIDNNLYNDKECLLANLYFILIKSWRRHIVVQNDRTIIKLLYLLKFIKLKNPQNFSYIKYLYLVILCRYVQIRRRILKKCSIFLQVCGNQ